MSDQRASSLAPGPVLAPAPARSAEPLLCLDGIWRWWGRGRKRWAVLRGVDLQVAPGTAVGIEGGNGTGKTTLLRIATAILAPDSGTVRVDGIDSRHGWREYHRRIGFLSAGDRGLYARFSVRGHLDYCARLALIPGSGARQAVDAALDRFGLAELTQRRADRLSQGQRQRLRLALACVHGPKVLLLDEPRNSLDDEGLAILDAAVADVLSRGGVVICCSPAGEQQRLNFDRSYVIEDGTLKDGAR